MFRFPVTSIYKSQVQKCRHENDSSSRHLLHLLLLWPQYSQRQAIHIYILKEFSYNSLTVFPKLQAFACNQSWYTGLNLIQYDGFPSYHFPEMVIVLYTITKGDVLFLGISFCFLKLKLMPEFCLFNFNCVFCQFYQ